MLGLSEWNPKLNTHHLVWGTGIGRLPREPQGCTGSSKEFSGDAQDPEVDQCWDCPDEIRIRGSTHLVVCIFWIDDRLIYI